MTTAPLLNLDTLVIRPKIAIDNTLYEILSPDELPVLTSHALAAKGRRFDELMKKSPLDDIEQRELVALVIGISDQIMEPIPPQIRAQLSDAQRLSVTEAFTTLLLSKKTGTVAALIKGLVSTGVTSSPVSSDSTGAGPAGGSAKPPSRS